MSLTTSSGINCYDKRGKPMTDYAAIEKLLSDEKYRRVGGTHLKNGLWVSTVWLGLDHSFTGGKPVIFETMVFDTKDISEGVSGKELYQCRYQTLSQARAGHKRAVKSFQNYKRIK